MPMPPDHETFTRNLLANISQEAIRARESVERSVHAAFVDSAFNLADQFVISDIECNAVSQCDANGLRWYDVAAMVDPNEHAPESIDMASQALAYALGRNLFRPHDQFPNLWAKVERA